MGTWSIEEKQVLLNALNEHGPTKIEAICKELPLKSMTDVSVMITRYERLANYNQEDRCDKDTPIDNWTDVMRKHTDYNQLVPIARALRYIALFEERAEGDIKLGEIYEMLADVSQGIAPKQLDPQTSSFLFGTLSKMAKEVKKADNSEAEEFLSNLKIQNNNFTRTYTYGNKAKREFEDTSINPLRVPKGLYKKKKT